MAKELLFGESGRQALLKGVEQLSNSVAITLGPKGRNVVIEKKFGSPIITNDGVTIAREIDLKNAQENLGVQAVKEVATKTNDVAGDGTTTATLLAYQILKSGLKNVTAGANPMDLKRGIEYAVDVAIKNIKEMAMELKTSKEISQIATISANNDPKIGNLIADAMEKVGKDGVITVEEAKSLETHLEVVEGMQFDRGYLSAHMVTNTESMVAELQDAHILICEKKISSTKEFLPLLEKAAQAGKSLLVISENVENEPLATLIINKMRGVLTTVAIKAPGFGDNRKAMLGDIATLVGGKVVTEELGMDLETAGVEILGTAKKITVDKDTTTIIEGGGKKEDILKRIAMLKTQVMEAASDYDREKLEERLGRLSGGVAVINVGAATELELKEKKARVEDALSATRAAVEEGIVPGGGLTLVRVIAKLNNIKLKGDQQVGVNIVKSVLDKPMKQIATNAGFDGSIIVEKAKSTSGNIGFNAQTGEWIDLIQDGVIDPAKVTRSALQNAASIAALLLTTEATVSEIKEDNPPQAGPPMGGGAPGMMPGAGMY